MTIGRKIWLYMMWLLAARGRRSLPHKNFSMFRKMSIAKGE